MPIGEIFNLERAAEYCAEIGRWSFFVSSEVSPESLPKAWDNCLTVLLSRAM
jgi:hypothetical protein